LQIRTAKMGGHFALVLLMAASAVVLSSGAQTDRPKTPLANDPLFNKMLPDINSNIVEDDFKPPKEKKIPEKVETSTLGMSSSYLGAIKIFGIFSFIRV
jgi:hypothetical protein